MTTKKKTETVGIEIQAVDRVTIEYAIVGQSPMLMHAMSAKSTMELLLPSKRKTEADKAASLKHDPYREFRDALYLDRPDGDMPTFCVIPCNQFKAAIKGAALDLQGSSKAQIGRLVWVEDTYAPCYGIPQLHMAMARNAGQNRTPDPRTRPIFVQWASTIRVSFVRPLLNEKTITRLAAAAGLTHGIGDWRPEKGSGNFGQFRVTNFEDPEFRAIVDAGGRTAQALAIDAPIAFDVETERMLEWFESEAESRGMKTYRSKQLGAVA